jgi:cupin fold WbuC family metalloprotein
VRIIDQQLLDLLSSQAQENPRLRKNYNLHPSDDSCCHRLLNAIEPGSYIRPHRHMDPAKDESFIILRGMLGIITFDESGAITEKIVLTAGNESLAANIPHGVFHAAVSLAIGTVFFEAKAGPYMPLTEAEQASWAPEEGTPAAPAYLTRLKTLF